MPPHDKTASSLRRPSVESRLPTLIENFKRDVKAYLGDADQNKVGLASFTFKLLTSHNLMCRRFVMGARVNNRLDCIADYTGVGLARQRQCHC